MYNNIVPGRYPITVEGNVIRFSIGRRHFGILKSNFMNNREVPIDCIFDFKKEDVLFPLQNYNGNHFYLGKYSEYHIRIDFNNLEIEKNTL